MVCGNGVRDHNPTQLEKRELSPPHATFSAVPQSGPKNKPHVMAKVAMVIRRVIGMWRGTLYAALVIATVGQVRAFA